MTTTPSFAPDSLPDDAAHPDDVAHLDDAAHVDDEAAGAADPAAPTGADAQGANPATEADEVVARDVVDPETVRRAPKLKAFAFAGVVAGLVLGTIIGLIALPSNHPGWSRAVFTLEITLVAVAIALIWALIADKRSLRP